MSAAAFMDIPKSKIRALNLSSRGAESIAAAAMQPDFGDRMKA
jgi:hypothetical protein